MRCPYGESCTHAHGLEELRLPYGEAELGKLGSYQAHLGVELGMDSTESTTGESESGARPSYSFNFMSFVPLFFNL